MARVKKKFHRPGPSYDPPFASEFNDDQEPRRELPPHAVAVLKAWLLSPEHIQHPYPDSSDQERLMAQTGIDKKQLKNWFTNARRRIWKPLLKEKFGAEVYSSGPGGQVTLDLSKATRNIPPTVVPVDDEFSASSSSSSASQAPSSSTSSSLETPAVIEEREEGSQSTRSRSMSGSRSSTRSTRGRSNSSAGRDRDPGPSAGATGRTRKMSSADTAAVMTQLALNVQREQADKAAQAAREKHEREMRAYPHHSDISQPHRESRIRRAVGGDQFRRHHGHHDSRMQVQSHMVQSQIAYQMDSGYPAYRMPPQQQYMWQWHQAQGQGMQYQYQHQHFYQHQYQPDHQQHQQPSDDQQQNRTSRPPLQKKHTFDMGLDLPGDHSIGIDRPALEESPELAAEEGSVDVPISPLGALLDQELPSGNGDRPVDTDGGARCGPRTCHFPSPQEQQQQQQQQQLWAAAADAVAAELDTSNDDGRSAEQRRLRQESVGASANGSAWRSPTLYFDSSSVMSPSADDLVQQVDYAGYSVSDAPNKRPRLSSPPPSHFPLSPTGGILSSESRNPSAISLGVFLEDLGGFEDDDFEPASSSPRKEERKAGVAAGTSTPTRSGSSTDLSLTLNINVTHSDGTSIREGSPLRLSCFSSPRNAGGAASPATFSGGMTLSPSLQSLASLFRESARSQAAQDAKMANRREQSRNMLKRERQWEDKTAQDDEAITAVAFKRAKELTLTLPEQLAEDMRASSGTPRVKQEVNERLVQDTAASGDAKDMVDDDDETAVSGPVSVPTHPITPHSPDQQSPALSGTF